MVDSTQACLSPLIPEARNADQESETAEPLGLPVLFAVFVDIVDLGEVEDAVSPALPDSVLLTVSSVVPTVTSETVSAITTVNASSNIVYEVLKHAQVDKTHANVTQQHCTGKCDIFI